MYYTEEINTQEKEIREEQEEDLHASRKSSSSG
jgi:hypothetical protein